MRRLLFIAGMVLGLQAMPLSAKTVTGRVTDGRLGLPGVSVYPDRLRHPWPTPLPPIATTDVEGSFILELADSDDVLVVEKSGWQRDLVPQAEWQAPIALAPAPEHRVEKALVVRLDFPDEASAISDDTLRERFFYRQPGVASVANYFFEVSKGSLEFEEGAILHLVDREHAAPRRDEDRGALVRWVIAQLKGLKLGDLDRVNNRTGALVPDGKPDHLWIIAPGPSQTITTNHAHRSPISFLERLPWDRECKWSALFLPEDTPLGNLVHEAFHAMGEHRVDDFYLDESHPLTAGIWDLMDVGMYRGWDRHHPEMGPWFADVAYSPSQPMGWTRAELWYGGRFRETVTEERVTGRSWTGWLDVLERAPGRLPQRLIVPDLRKPGCFWELNVRRPWGFDRGRIGDRWGVGHEGLVVAAIDSSKLTPDEPQGPVHVVDAHPGSAQPPLPRAPNGRWELDDAAFNLGPGETPKGHDGPLSWEVLAVDEFGRMRVRVRRAR